MTKIARKKDEKILERKKDAKNKKGGINSSQKWTKRTRVGS